MATQSKNGTSRCTSISLDRDTKARLDAIAVAGRRSRTATIELLMDAYLENNPRLNAVIQDSIKTKR